MKYLTAIFLVLTIVLLFIGTNTHKKNQTLERTKLFLESDVGAIREQINAVAPLTGKTPEEILTTYARLLASLTALNRDLDLEIKVRIQGVDDYQTVIEAVRPSEITGVKRLIFMLDSESELSSTLYAISVLQRSYPILFYELQREQRKTGMVFSLYGT